MLPRPHAAFLALVLTFAPNSFLGAQDDPELAAKLMARLPIRTAFRLDEKNRWQRVRTRDPYAQFDVSPLLWLVSPPVCDEVGLSDEQRRAITELRIAAALNGQGLAGLAWAASKGGTLPEVQAALDEAEQRQRELEASLSDLLSPEQQIRWNQLKRREFFLRYGIDGVLLNGTWRGELAISDIQRTQIAALLDAFGGELEGICSARGEQQFEGVLKLLSQSQATQMREAVSDRRILAVPLELHEWQLATATSLAEEPEDEPVFAEYLRHAKPFRSSRYSQIELDYDYAGQKTMNYFLALCQSELYRGGEILTYQLADIFTYSDRDRAVQAELGTKLDQLRFDIVERRISSVDSRRATSKITADYDAWEFRRLEAKLLPPQVEELHAVATRRLIAMRGLHGCLVNGCLGQQLQLTKEQREAIRTDARAQHESVVKQSQALERAIWKRVAGLLTPEQGTALDKRIGPAPEHLPGIPGFLVLSKSAAG